MKAASASTLGRDATKMTMQIANSFVRKHVLSNEDAVTFEQARHTDHIALTMLSDIFLASPSSIMVLSR